MENLGVLIPIIAVGGPFAMGIIGMMLRHQRKMAELYGQNANVVDPRVEALQSEIAGLKDLVHQQSIALDNLSRPVPTGARIQERVG